MKKQLAIKLLLLIVFNTLFIPLMYQNETSLKIFTEKKAIPNHNEFALAQATNEVSLYEYSRLDDDGGRVRGVTIQNDLAFVANEEQGLEILDVSNPTQPTKISSIKTKGFARDVLVLNNFSYVAQLSRGVAVINVENPHKPVYIKNILNDTTVLEIDFYRNLLYIITTNGLYTYEVSNPFEPLFISHWERSPSYSSSYTGVSVVYKYVCLSNELTGLEIVDMTFTSNPTLIGTWKGSTGKGSGVFTTYIGEKTIAFLANEYSGLEVIDYTDPQAPTKIGNYDVLGKIIDVFVKNNIAYCCKYNLGLVLLDVSDPSNPVEQDSYDTDDSCLDVWVFGNYAFAADDENGLLILRISNPTSIYKVAEYFDHGSASRVVVEGDLVYLVDESAGLEIIDISDPENPIKIGQYDEDDINVKDVTIVDNLAIVSALDLGIYFLDISDKTNPTKIASYVDGKVFVRTIAKGDLVFAGSLQTSSILVLNISNLPTINVEGEYIFSTPETSVNALEIDDNILIAGSDKEGVTLLNITDLSNITLVVSYDIGLVNDFCRNEDVLFTANQNNNLTIFNVSNNNITKVSEIDIGGIAEELTISNDIAYIAIRYNGIKIVNVSYINNPEKAGEYQEIYCFGIKTYRQYVITGAQDEGLRLFALDSDSDLITDADELEIWGTDPYDEDTDGDLIPDGFEAYNQLDPLDSSDKWEDPDQDDLTNFGEYIQKFNKDFGGSTDPQNPDTDFDLMPDGWEVENDINPLEQNADKDYDFDYLTNYEEYLFGTDPQNPDTDGDGAKDGIEILYNTDPLNPKDNPARNRLIRFIIVLVSAFLLIAGGSFLLVRYIKKRITRNLERDRRIQESEDDVLIF
ncbi:MAG: hypothetical protein HZR80_11765 [Candidatus Heimdallarchaeota archaeon]